MMNVEQKESHIPIDAKDKSPAFRRRIWQSVAQRIGSPLTPVPANAAFSGIWDVDAEMFGTRQPMFEYDFSEDGTMTITSTSGAAVSTEEDSYAVRREGQLVMSGETYHAATTEAGVLVLFNGDASLVLIAKKRE
ncbi:MAG: hypothetical protein WEB58_12185 [Planctomycetaceae bacterium]